MKFFLAVFIALISVPAFAQEAPLNPKPFGLWLQEFKADAAREGISQATLDETFANTAPIEHIIELDRKQPESRITLAKYLAGAVAAPRIAEGREKFEEHRDTLDAVAKKYHVQAPFIVALWGIETSFGENTGNFSIPDALATLAYDGRRSDYFRGELIKALKIIDQEHIAPAEMTGSWAGAMGQCQFMPASFLQFAVDYDGDGKRDIWGTEADVFASIANYLSSSGWDDHVGWGAPATIAENFDRTLADITQTKTLAQWQALGVRTRGEFPADTQLSLILVGEGADAASYLVTGNYKVLLKWNRSRYFATAVSMLADAIEAQP